MSDITPTAEDIDAIASPSRGRRMGSAFVTSLDKWSTADGNLIVGIGMTRTVMVFEMNRTTMATAFLIGCKGVIAPFPKKHREIERLRTNFARV